jgi:hypothetical protein
MERRQRLEIIKGEKVSSALTDTRKTEAWLRYYDHIFKNMGAFIERMRIYNPKLEPVEEIKRLEKAREEAMRRYTAQRKKQESMKIPAWSAFSFDRSEYQSFHHFREAYFDKLSRFYEAIAEAACPTISGVTSTRFLIVEDIIEWPDDNDTEWNYDGRFYDVYGSYYSLMFDHWMRDHTHWYSVDALDLMWVISHYGFQFPAPPCDGTLYYEADLRLIVSAFINADDGTGVLLVDLLSHEQPVAGSAPGSFDNYETQLGQQVFTSTDFKSDGFLVTGSFEVEKDQTSVLWFGLATLVSAKGGFAGTNGWSYLMVAPPPGETQPGVKYTVVPR